MSIAPNWYFAAGLLLVGVFGGAYVDHSIMQGRIDKMIAVHTEELRVREVKRADDERTARNNERQMTEAVALAEQEKTDAIQLAHSSADQLLARLRNQAASKPASTGGVPQAATNCQVAAGGEFPIAVGADLVSLAERADELRAGLASCYQAYDSVAR